MKILATFDQSPFSEAIVPLLGRIAALPDAELILLCVADLPGSQRRRGSRGSSATIATAPGGGDAFVVPAPPQRYIETRSQAIYRSIGEVEDYLHAVAHRLPEGTRYTVQAAIGTDPATTIIEQAREINPDVIVMATHGRTGIVRALFGSVAEMVVRSGIAPVLLVHPEDVRRERQNGEDGPKRPRRPEPDQN